ncbi:zincin-like metallopeptidase toxin domain-containing protein [Bacillus cereus]|nr:zincin-like metallopeptidase toxin domain-containing protein [Bacillus cereus]
MWDAFRDTTIGAVSGAIFGPYGGIWASIGGRMTFQGMVGAAESLMRQAMDGEGLSWKTTLFDAAISFGTAGLLDPKVLKPVGGFIKKQVGTTSRWISDSAGDISRKFSNYMDGLSENGNTLARIYVEHEQKGLAGLAKELGEALQKDLSQLGSNAREQLEKLRNSLNPPPRYQLAGASHMGNEASDLFENMSKELTESLEGLKSKLDNVMKSSSGGSDGKPPGSKGTGDFDYKEWENMPVSGQTRLTADGLRIMSIRDLKKFKKDMNDIGIKVILDKKGKILPGNVAGGFDPYTGQMVLRPDASLLSALHESYHAKQFRELGQENYLKQSRAEREEYVYNEIMKNKEKFSAEEIYEAQRYIFFH